MAEEIEVAMLTVDKCTDEVAGIIRLLTGLSNAQANSVPSITVRIDRITPIVQSNTFAAEQTAAASEELTGQANALNAMVGRYRM